MRERLKAAQELELFSSKISQAEKNIKNLNDVQKEASKTAGEDITKARLLYQATTDVNLSMVGSCRGLYIATSTPKHNNVK